MLCMFFFSVFQFVQQFKFLLTHLNMIYEHIWCSLFRRFINQKNKNKNNVCIPTTSLMFMFWRVYVKTLINHSSAALKGWLSVVVEKYEKKLKHQKLLPIHPWKFQHNNFPFIYFLGWLFCCLHAKRNTLKDLLFFNFLELPVSERKTRENVVEEKKTSLKY